MEQQSLDDSTSVYNTVYWMYEAQSQELLLRNKDSFQILLFTDNTTSHPRAILEI